MPPVHQPRSDRSVSDGPNESRVWALQDIIKQVANERSGPEGTAAADALFKPPADANPVDIDKLVQSLNKADDHAGGRADAPATKPREQDPETAARSADRDGGRIEVNGHTISEASIGGFGDTAPGGGTRWLQNPDALPYMQEESKTFIVSRLDAEIQKMNTEQFKVDPLRAWKPSGADLPTGSNISTLSDSYKLAQTIPTAVILKAEALIHAFSGTGEPIIDEQQARIKPALLKLIEELRATQAVSAHIAAIGTAANDGFHQLRGIERKVQEQSPPPSRKGDGLCRGVKWVRVTHA